MFHANETLTLSLQQRSKGKEGAVCRRPACIFPLSGLAKFTSFISSLGMSNIFFSTEVMSNTLGIFFFFFGDEQYVKLFFFSSSLRMSNIFCLFIYLGMNNIFSCFIFFFGDEQHFQFVSSSFENSNIFSFSFFGDEQQFSC